MQILFCISVLPTNLLIVKTLSLNVESIRSCHCIFTASKHIMYRVSHNIGSTLFYVIILGYGACTEELLTIFQQPWKFAI